MSDATLDLNPVTNPDVQEGASLAHSAEAVLILPLKSGNLAVFGRDFQVHAILYEAPSIEDIRRFSREIAAKIRASARDAIIESDIETLAHRSIGRSSQTPQALKL